MQFLDALGIVDVDLVGNDGGGAVAQLFAVAHPDRVRSLVLTNCDALNNWPPQAFQRGAQLFFPEERRQSPGQPHKLDIALGFALQTAARTHRV
jgi:pimeloyl-ACP methyl ester carboxylesterase